VARWLGEGAARAISKVLHILLAAIAVTFIRRGVLEVWP
jgi:small neutral amino acid transporter SnatA (MarC family)